MKFLVFSGHGGAAVRHYHFDVGTATLRQQPITSNMSEHAKANNIDSPIYNLT